MKRISGVIAVLLALTGVSTTAAGERGLSQGAATLVAYNYVHFSTFDRFVAAIEESRELASAAKEKDQQTSYRNIHTFESFTAMLVDNYDASANGNVQSEDTAFPALFESCTDERYGAIMDRSRFSALKETGCGFEADLLANPSWTCI